MRTLRNISTNEMRRVLAKLGLTLTRTRGGHEAWTKPGLKGRPVIIQNHIEPVPEFIVRNAIIAIGISRQEFVKTLESI